MLFEAICTRTLLFSRWTQLLVFYVISLLSSFFFNFQMVCSSFGLCVFISSKFLSPNLSVDSLSADILLFVHAS